MMNEIQDPDTAWAEFQMKSQDRIAKTSMAGQLDTLASMLRSVEANVGELSDLLIPRLAGEQHASEQAAEAGPTSDDPLAAMAGGTPEDQTGQPPQDAIEKSEEEEDVKNEDKPVDETIEEVDEFTTDDEPTEAPAADEGAPAPEADEVEEVAVLADEPAPDAGEAPVAAEAAVTEPAPAAPAEDPLIGGYKAFSDAMKQAAHRAIDSGKTDLIGRFVDAQAAMDSVWQTVICPLMDSINANDGFAKSLENPEVFVKGCTPDVDKAMDAPKVPAPESAPKAGGSEPTASLAKSESMIDEVSDADSHATAKEGDVPLDEVADKSPDHGEAPEGDVPLDDVKVAKTEGTHSSDGEHEEDLTEFEKAHGIPSFADLMKGGAAHQRMMDKIDQMWSDKPATNPTDYIFSGSFGKSAPAEPVQASAEIKSEDVGTVADVQENTDVPVTKHIETFDEVLARHNVYKCGNRPQVASTSGGDVTRPELEFEPVAKSQPKVRMGYGVDPKSVTANDWEEYHRFMKSRNASL